MKKLFYGVSILAAAAMLACCAGGKERRITIISTNDTHASIDMFARLATLVDSLRRGGQDVLLVHAGDWSTGNPYADLYPRNDYPNIALMDSLGYDLATLGNHEFDHGTDTLAARLAEATFEVVVANMQSNGSLPDLPSYRLIDVSGLRIGVLGLITVTPSGYPDGFVYNFGRTTFSDPIETARKYAFLRDSCDLVIALTHIGYEQDSLLASAAPWIDLVIGGHSHTTLPEGRWTGGDLQTGGGAFITQTGSKLQYAGVTTLAVDEQGRVVDMTNMLVDLATLPPTPRIAAMVERFKSEGEFGRQIGLADSCFDRPALCNLFADALREGAGADIALVNGGGVRLERLDSGRITRGDLFSLEPFRNRACLVELTRDEIDGLIREKFNSVGKESHTIDLWPSGMRYTLTVDDAGEMAGIEMSIDNPSRRGRYRVAMSDYVYGSYRFTHRSHGVDTGRPLTSLLVEYVEKHSPLNPDSETRATVRGR
ncbi:hypothetical protein FACS1894159_10320 [Bacteroidia bacterium]|nr:hypothetical protein FACS1894159_10320 [Bacteroidia bacterium]